MSGVLLTVLFLLALGSLFAQRTCGVFPIPRFAAFAFLYGSGVAAVGLLLLSTIRVTWTLPVFLVVAVALGAAARLVPAEPLQWSATTGGGRAAGAFAAISVAIAGAAHARFATRAPLTEWDFLAIWGLKARTFLVAGGIDWAFLERVDNLFSNPDYPPLVPLLLDVNGLVSGGWEGHWIGLLFTMFGFAAFAVAWSSVRTETSSALLLAAGTVLFLFPAFSDRIGLAEAPMIAFAVGAVVLVRRGLARDEARLVALGGLLLGCAALTKNEGLALTVAVCVAAVVARPRLRLLAALTPGLGLAVWWQLLRAAHELPTLRARGQIGERVTANLSNLREWAPLLWTELEKPLFWIALALLAAVAGAAALWRERFLGTVVVVQTAAILSAYMVSHVELKGELVYSWERLSHQLALIAALFVVHALIHRFSDQSKRGGPEPAS